MFGYLYFGRGYFGEDGIRGIAIEVPTGTLVFTGQTPSIRIFDVFLELNGYGNGWTDVTFDVTAAPIAISRGFQSISPNDVVAEPSICQFGLNNSETNMAKTMGYYSPDSASARPGFDEGIRCKVEVTTNGSTRTRFVGWIQSVSPKAGLFDEKTTAVTAASWMKLAQETLIEGVTVQAGKRGDQLISTLAAVPTFPPPATLFAVGPDIFPFAFDDLTIESAVVDGFDRVCMSGLDRLFEKADGTLVYETRLTRQQGKGPKLTLTDAAPADRPGQALVTFPLSRSMEALWSAITLTVHPKNVDASPVVLYAYQTTGSAASIAAGASIILSGPYQDPNQLAQQVGGINMLTATGIGTSGDLPASDWQITSLPNGAGVDLSASCAVRVSYDATRATFFIDNHSGSLGYISKLQCRGQGVYNYQVVSCRAVNTVVSGAFGKQSLTIDCPYQAIPTTAQTLAEYLLYAYGQRRSQFDSGILVQVPATDQVSADALLALEVGDAIAVKETVTGLTGTFWVNHIQESWDDLMNLTMVLELAPMTINTVPSGVLTLSGLAPNVLISGVPIPVPTGSLSFTGQTPTVGNAPVWQLGVPGSGELGDKTFLS